VHVFSAVGTYTVSVVISDGPCFSTATRTIIIYPVPVGTFTITPDHPCPAPVTISYNSTVTPGASVSWTFITAADNSTATGITAAHTFTLNGVYLAQMTVTTPQGCSISVSQADTIFNLIVAPEKGCDTLAVQFTAAPTTTTPDGLPKPYPYGPFTYSWSYGDGASGTGESPTHIYSATGTYVATLTMTTGNGCPVTRTIQVQPILSMATFTVTPTRVCYGDTVSVTPDTITGPVDLYEWYWGDGGTETKPAGYTHVYNRPGEFVITVTPTYHNCKGRRFVTTDTVTVDSPQANIQFAYSCINKDQVAFFDTVSLGADSHLWVFGDGDSSTATNPVHTYPGTGHYNVFLYTLNSASGCRDTADQPVGVIRLHPNFAAIDSAVCRDDTVRFTSRVSTGPDSLSATASLYEWYVNGVFLPLETNSTYTDTFNIKGIYTIRMVSIDAHGCRDTITKPNYLHVAKPVARFRANTVGCAPLIANFVDSTTDIPGTTFTEYAWSFGDLTSATATVPTIAHTYTAGGTYTITEIVTDNIGCKDTFTRPSYIKVNKPFAFFYADNVHPCAGTTVTFTNMTAGITGSSWLFGDGGSSTAISPTHVYTAAGTYTIRLAVTDTLGCHDTAVYAAYLNVTKPHAAFAMDDTFNVCPPLTANFVNTSTGATSYVWNFGDGNASVVPSPTNIYVAPGMYNARLIATDAYGCKDTAIKHATVYGYAGAFGYSPLSGCSPLPVHFSASVAHNGTGITWDFADGVTVSAAADTVSHIYNTPGAYVPKLILSDSSGCTNFSRGLDTIKVDRVNAAFKTIPNHVCKGGSISFVDSSTSRFSPVYTWSWAFDGGTSTLTSPSHAFTTAGTIPVTLTATNGWGCTATITKTVTINPLPAVTASPDTIVCSGSTTTLVAAGAATYTWAGGALSCNTCATTFATPTVSTTYTVTGVDTNGCINKDTARINLLSAIASGGGAICPGETITLANVGAGTWSSGTPTIASVMPATGVVTGMNGGIATITYTLPAGCFATVTVTVDAVPPPISGALGICVGANDTLTDALVGGTWSTATAAIVTVDPAAGIVNGVAAGTAVVTYTMPTGCYITAVVTVNPLPGPITGSVPMCEGAIITLSNTLAGGSWESAGPAIATITTGGVVTGVTAGTATITYNHAGCTTMAVVTVAVTPDAGTITGPVILCIGATITLTDTATGTWSCTNTAVATIGSTGIVTGHDSGAATIVYTTPTNSAGCFDTAAYRVVVTDPSFTIDRIVDYVSCFGGRDGRVQVAVNGRPPYEYVWSNGSDTTYTDSLTAGVYSVIVTETVSQCRKTDTFTVSQPDSLIVNALASPDSCFMGSGRIILTVSGGVSPYSYLWSDNSATNEVAGLLPGTYSVTVTDMHSCAVRVSAVITEDSCNDISIYDIITPNGDGVNEVWVIPGLNRYPQNTVQIFDKWGDIVYEKSNYNGEWYGQSRGSALLPDGTYFYLMKLNAPNRAGGDTVFKGTVMIKR
jgi:gliding motility-associated-like protein